MENKYNLEDRLLEFATEIIRLVEQMPATRAASHVSGQILRSGTSPLFNHGEAQAAESPKDFLHKLRICLKELRETKRALRLIMNAALVDDMDKATTLLNESDELIRIFVASIRTAEQKVLREDDTDRYNTE